MRPDVVSERKDYEPRQFRLGSALSIRESILTGNFVTGVPYASISFINVGYLVSNPIVMGQWSHRGR